MRFQVSSSITSMDKIYIITLLGVPLDAYLNGDTAWEEYKIFKENEILPKRGFSNYRFFEIIIRDSYNYPNITNDRKNVENKIL